MAVGLAQREIGSANAALRDIQKIQAQQDAIKEQVRIRKEQEDLLRKASNKAMVNQLQSSILPYYGKDAWNAAKQLVSPAQYGMSTVDPITGAGKEVIYQTSRLGGGASVVGETALPTTSVGVPINTTGVPSAAGLSSPGAVSAVGGQMYAPVDFVAAAKAPTVPVSTSAVDAAPTTLQYKPSTALTTTELPISTTATSTATGSVAPAATETTSQLSSAMQAAVPQKEAVTGAIAASTPVSQELTKGAVAGGADIAQAGAEATSVAAGAEKAGALGGLNLGMDQALGALGMGLSVWSLAENGANVGNVSGIVGGGLALASMLPELALLGPVGLGIGAVGGIASLIFDI